MRLSSRRLRPTRLLLPSLRSWRILLRRFLSTTRSGSFSARALDEVSVTHASVKETSVKGAPSKKRKWSEVAVATKVKISGKKIKFDHYADKVCLDLSTRIIEMLETDKL
jgi:hypothetical protein